MDMNFGINLLPDQTGTYDLGSNNKKWNNIYINNINGTDVDEFRSNGNIVDIIYPVGSIYMSVANTNPTVLFGGTWEQLEDKFLLGAGSTYTAGDTGGAASVSYTPEGSVGNHTLTIDEIPSHNHSFTGSEVTSGNQSAGHTHNYTDYYATTTGNTAISTAQMPSHSHCSIANARGSATSGNANYVGTYADRAVSDLPYSLRYTNSPGPSLGYTSGSGSTNSHNHSGVNSATDRTSYGISANHNHKVTASGSVGSKGGGRAHNHGFTGTATTISTMSPYLVVYMWKRTA